MATGRVLFDWVPTGGEIHIWKEPEQKVFDQGLGTLRVYGGNLSIDASGVGQVGPTEQTFGRSGVWWCTLWRQSGSGFIQIPVNGMVMGRDISDMRTSLIPGRRYIVYEMYSPDAPQGPVDDDPPPVEPPPSNPPPTNVTGHIEGYVYVDDGQTSTPQGGVQVTFEGISATSTLDGHYILHNCPLMSSLLSATLSPYGTFNIGVTVISGQTVTQNVMFQSIFNPPPPPPPPPVDDTLMQDFAFALPYTPNASQMGQYRAFIATALPIVTGAELVDMQYTGPNVTVRLKNKYVQNAVLPTGVIIVALIAAAVIIFGVAPMVTSFFNTQEQAWETTQTGTIAETITKLTELLQAGTITQAQFDAAVAALQSSTDPGEGGSSDPWAVLQELIKNAPWLILGLIALYALKSFAPNK